MVIDRAVLEQKVVALMYDGHAKFTVPEARGLKDDAKGVYNPETMDGDPEEALLKSISAARAFARFARSEDRMRWEEREAFVIQARGMYDFAMNVSRSVGLVATGELIYKEFDAERVKLGRMLKAYKKERKTLERKIKRRAYDQ